MERRPLKLLVLGLNYSPELVGIAVYTSGMAEALVKDGFEVTVVAGQPYYPGWKVRPGFPAFGWTGLLENGVQIVRCPHYVPKVPSGPRRIVHHLTFALSSFVPMLANAIRARPDVVMAVAPSLIAAPVALLAATICGARSWLHIQDFEVDAAAATGLVREGVGLRIARRIESALLRAFDKVSSISPKMCERLISKGVPADRVVEFRNWADIDAIRPLDRPSAYRAEWNITTPHVALYSGNIANKQGIEIVVEAARMLQSRSDITFVVCGDGPNRASLESQAVGLKNIQLHGLQPKEKLNELLGLATIHLMPQRSGAADLVLPSKLGNMLASGRPIVATADQGTGLAMEVEGCGIVVPAGDINEFSAAIIALADDQALVRELGAAAAHRAVSRWRLSSTISALEQSMSTVDNAKATR